MLKFLMAFMLFSNFEVQAACEELRVLHGLVNLKHRTWETTHVNKRPDKVCGELPKPPRINLEVTITKGKKKFTALLYRPLLGYWDGTNNNGKTLEGGRYEIKYLPIETFVPAWYKGAIITVKEMPSKKVIVEAKL